MTCVSCNKECPDDARFCPNCGMTIVGQADNVNEPDDGTKRTSDSGDSVSASEPVLNDAPDAEHTSNIRDAAWTVLDCMESAGFIVAAAVVPSLALSISGLFTFTLNQFGGLLNVLQSLIFSLSSGSITAFAVSPSGLNGIILLFDILTFFGYLCGIIYFVLSGLRIRFARLVLALGAFCFAASAITVILVASQMTGAVTQIVQLAQLDNPALTSVISALSQSLISATPSCFVVAATGVLIFIVCLAHGWLASHTPFGYCVAIPVTDGQ